MRQAAGNLLSDDEPAPVRRIAPTGDIPMLLTADHASNRIPRALDGMGVSPEVLERHIAWDPGSRGVAEMVAELTGASALLCEYSRLVVFGGFALSAVVLSLNRVLLRAALSKRAGLKQRVLLVCSTRHLPEGVSRHLRLRARQHMMVGVVMPRTAHLDAP